MEEFTHFILHPQNFKMVHSLKELNREILEAYLIDISTQKVAEKTLNCLKSVFHTAACVLEDDKLSSLFVEDDFAPIPRRIYKFYTDAEMKRLIDAVAECDVQIARVLILHAMLGLRISETLTLKQNGIHYDASGIMEIRIDQIKTKKAYEKEISEDIKKVFDAACEYTNKHFGKREYVFVSKNKPDEPLNYSALQYRLMCVITQKDLRDDNGERFQVGTHLFRHSFGKKLAEQNVDDVVIAKLLGHSGLGAVHNYRKIESKVLEEETRQMRQALDEMIKDIVAEWDD